MAAPTPGTSLESAIPLVQYQGLNTNKAVNLSGTTVDTSGNVSVAGTLGSTGALTPTAGVGPAGGFTSAARTIHTGGAPAVALTTGADTAFATTVTYFAEVFIPANVTVTGVRVLVGSAAGNGNLTVALANSSGAVVASSATTTTSGTATTFTEVAFSSTYAAVGPATYWVLVQGSSTSDKFRAQAAGPFGTGSKTAQTYGTLTSITPVTTFSASVGPIASLY